MNDKALKILNDCEDLADISGYTESDANTIDQLEEAVRQVVVPVPLADFAVDPPLERLEEISCMSEHIRRRLKAVEFRMARQLRLWLEIRDRLRLEEEKEERNED